MYCPVCLQNALKIKSNGVVKLTFNNKSRNTSLFTYNLQKDTPEQLQEKLRDRIEDFFKFYGGFSNKLPIKKFEAYSADFMCTNGCKLAMVKSKLTVIGMLFSANTVQRLLTEEGKKVDVEVTVTFS
jgi:hypothetical protein